jgi:hypothetical protein
VSETTQLVRYDAMCSAIASSYEVDEVKDIRDKARAMEAYFRLAKNTEAERQACEIRLRAERKAGQLLAQLDKAKGAPGNQHTGPVERTDGSKTLADLGISRNQSAQWQQLARVPDDDFEVSLQTEHPTTGGIIASHVAPKQRQMDDRALWLWGRLQDFERMGVLASDPPEMVAEMFEHMQETTRALAPRVAEWLGRIK